MSDDQIAVATASKSITVALAGNPNSGKTTVFNSLTGARQHVGNYPGVTVEKKEGAFEHSDREIQVVDLPGTYSLTAFSEEELVARRFVIEERPDVVVDIVDMSNLERNLYLATQFMELGVPLVLAFNMSDLAKQRGIEVNIDKLSDLLGVAIVPTVGHRGVGMEELKDVIVQAAADGSRRPARVLYGEEVERELAGVEAMIEQEPLLAEKYHPRWMAIKLLEADAEARHAVEEAASEASAILAAAEQASARIERDFGDSVETVIADRRYGFISGACTQALKRTVEMRHTRSDQIDLLMTHRVLGLPIFLGLMYLVFKLTFTLGGPPMDWIDSGFGWLGDAVSSLWPAGSESALRSLLVDGVIAGVGGVLVFLPNILLLFLAISILEDSGYMARAAFIMDRVMSKIGLHGKSFIPLLLGFGCTIPAIMATRTLENRRDRLTTMLVAPLMSCGARLPIYMLIIPAFFPRAWQAPILWGIYLIGIVLAIGAAKLLRSTLFRGEAAPFVMELPPYRMPTLKGVLIHMWERGELFLRKAGTIILGVSVLLWAATVFPRLPDGKREHFDHVRHEIRHSPLSDEAKSQRLKAIDDEESEASLQHSIAGRIGRALEPVFRPIGFDWKLVTPVIGAIAAKEVFVAQLGIVYSVGEADEESASLRDKLQARYSPLTGFCILLFMLVVAPCMATFAVMKSESGSWTWAFVQFGGLTALAYVLTLLVYQLGQALDIGASPL